MSIIWGLRTDDMYLTIYPKYLGRYAEGSESLVGEKLLNVSRNPEYHGTRGILWEAGGTTLQGKILLNDR